MSGYLDSTPGIFLVQLRGATCSNRAITEKNRRGQISRSELETTPDSVTEYLFTLGCYRLAASG
jgi:hypothetical protein